MINLCVCRAGEVFKLFFFQTRAGLPCKNSGYVWCLLPIFFLNCCRNGHKLTHASKKPHGCQFCDKSYSDARSLRRHYENAHPDEYESWRLISRAAEGGDTTVAAAVAKMTLQLSNAASANAGNGGEGSSSSLAQHLAKGAFRVVQISSYSSLAKDIVLRLFYWSGSMACK